MANAEAYILRSEDPGGVNTLTSSVSASRSTRPLPLWTKYVVPGPASLAKNLSLDDISEMRRQWSGDAAPVVGDAAPVVEELELEPTLPLLRSAAPEKKPIPGVLAPAGPGNMVLQNGSPSRNTPVRPRTEKSVLKRRSASSTPPSEVHHAQHTAALPSGVRPAPVRPAASASSLPFVSTYSAMLPPPVPAKKRKAAERPSEASLVMSASRPSSPSPAMPSSSSSDSTRQSLLTEPAASSSQPSRLPVWDALDKQPPNRNVTPPSSPKRPSKSRQKRGRVAGFL